VLNQTIREQMSVGYSGLPIQSTGFEDGDILDRKNKKLGGCHD